MSKLAVELIWALEQEGALWSDPAQEPDKTTALLVKRKTATGRYYYSLAMMITCVVVMIKCQL